MTDKNYTVGELINILENYDPDSKLRVLDFNGFTMNVVEKVVMLDGRVTIIQKTHVRTA